MTVMNFKVPSIACDGCAKTITEEILTHEPAAKVDVDVKAKSVNVDTEASEESIRQMITAVGHTVEQRQDYQKIINASFIELLELGESNIGNGCPR